MNLLVCLWCIGIQILLAEITTVFSSLATSITPTSVDYRNVQSDKIAAQDINVTALSLLPSSNVDIVTEQSSLNHLLLSVTGPDLTTNLNFSQSEHATLMTTPSFMVNSTFTPHDTLSTHSIEISPSIYDNESASFLSTTNTTMSTTIHFTEMSSIPTTDIEPIPTTDIEPIPTTDIEPIPTTDIEPIGSTSFDISQTQIPSTEYISSSSIIDYSTSSEGPTRPPNNKQGKGLSTVVIIVIIIAVILLAAVGFVCFWRRRRKFGHYGMNRSASYHKFTDDDENEAININTMPL